MVNENCTKDFEENYHPDYSAPDATLILVSKDGVRFRVHSNIMSMASDVFNGMLIKAVDTGEAIQLEENSKVLKMLLDMIYPNGPYFNLNDIKFDLIWLLLLAADKYDIRKIMQEFRIRILVDTHYKSEPLEAFAISSQFGWKQEIALLTISALDCLNTAHKSWKILIRLNSTHILKLLNLHKVRKDLLLRDLREGLLFDESLEDIWNMSLDVEFRSCKVYEGDYINSDAHETLLSIVGYEFTKTPSGVTLSGDFWHRSMVTWLFSETGIDSMKVFMRDALRNLPKDVNDFKIDQEFDI